MEYPIIAAAARGDLEEINKLIAAGANVNESNLDQFTPLMMAARERHPEIVERLLAAGANVNLRDSHGFAALHEVFAFYDMESEERIRTLKALLKAPDIDVNITSDNGITALDMLIDPYRVQDLDALRVLLDAGIDVNKPYPDGSLPIERVLRNIEAHRGRRNFIKYLKQVARILIEYGARPRKLSMLKSGSLGAKPLVSSLASGAFKRRMHAVSAWSAAHKARFPEAYEDAAAAGGAGAAAGGAGAAPRENGAGANKGGARRRSLKKRKASTTRRRRRA